MHSGNMDSYDKQKLYGRTVNDCSDGFSENEMWTEADNTNFIINNNT